MGAVCFAVADLQLLLCLIMHQGIFYLTKKAVQSTVFLKDAYPDSKLIGKHFNDKFVALYDRRSIFLWQ